MARSQSIKSGFVVVSLVSMLGILASAQTVGNLPTVRQGNTGYDSNLGCSHTANCINYPENVLNGSLIAGCIVYGSGGGGTAPSSVTDNLGTTITMESPQVVGSGATAQSVIMWHGFTSSSGSDWIIITGGSSFDEKTAAEFTGVGSIDGTIQTGTGSGGSPTGSVSASATSTVNNDIAIQCTTTDGAAQPQLTLGNVQFAASDNNTVPNLLETFANMGALGSQTFTNYVFHDNGSSHYVMQTLLFKPTPTIFLADTALPQAGTSAAYSAQLHCTGGVSTQTYSVFSGTLPTGITLNTSTGVLTASSVSGTTQTVGFKCTDGTNTSASDSLTITVGATLNTPSLGPSTSGSFGGGGQSLSPLSVQCGDIILMCVSQGDDTHGAAGWVQTLSGSANSYSDSLGSTVQRYVAYPGIYNGPNQCIVFGPMTTNGTDTISAVNNQSASSGLTAWAQVVHNAQNVLDTPTWTNNIGQNTASLSVNYTTVVPNELLVTLANDFPDNGGSITHNSPFTQQFVGSGGFTNQADATDAVASASTVTATANFTVMDANGQGDSLAVFALRPALTFTGCTAPTFAGEKIRRYVN